MRIYAICSIQCYEPDLIVRYYRTKEDAKWGMNKLLAGEDPDYECGEYGDYEIIEIEVEE